MLRYYLCTLIGTKLLHYEITAQLGEGGMGVVYRAMDTRLNREVAIKVLPEAFVADAERLARFQREAQLLASLNHPNIGAQLGAEAGAGRAGLGCWPQEPFEFRRPMEDDVDRPDLLLGGGGSQAQDALAIR